MEEQYPARRMPILFYRGPEALYSSSLHQNGVYFCTDTGNIIANNIVNNATTPLFRWDASTEYIGKIQVSMDLGTTWGDLSPAFSNNIRIKDYLTSTDELPITAPVGTIYAVGPVYDVTDVEHQHPSYNIYAKSSEGWVDNGNVIGVQAGVVLNLGNSTDLVMSQKAVTDELNAIRNKIVVLSESEFEAIENKNADTLYFVYE